MYFYNFWLDIFRTFILYQLKIKTDPIVLHEVKLLSQWNYAYIPEETFIDVILAGSF